MSEIIRGYDVDPEIFWDSVATWLDAIFATTYTSHRRLDEVTMHLDHVEQELMEFDRAVQVELTPSQQVSVHRLSLRYRDLDSVLDTKWSSTGVRRSTLRALRGIHERYLGPLPAGRQDEVLFEVNRHFTNVDLDAYVTSHRIDLRSRVTYRTGGNTRLDMSVVRGPIWVHDVYRHLTGTGIRGERLRARYACGANGRPWREPAKHHFLGEPVEMPTDDVIDAALNLWTPEEERSPYCRFAEAARAAALL